MAMKKVLMICYSHPPRGGVGAARSLKLAKYLKYFGWEPVILTPDESAPGMAYRGEDIGVGDIHVYRTEYRDIFRRFKKDKISSGLAQPKNERSPEGWFRNFVREMIAIPDEARLWRKFAVNAGLKVIKEERIDLIFSSSPPETSHLIGDELKKRSGVPWVSDLRDMWSLYHHAPRPALKRVILSVIEKAVLKNADKVTTVSDEWAGLIIKRDSLDPHSVVVVPNGFDEEDYAATSERRKDKLRFVYTGKLHRIYQNPELFLKALSHVLKKDNIRQGAVEADFYLTGSNQPDVEGLARQYGLNGIVHNKTAVDFRGAINAQRSASALLFFHWAGPYPYGWMSGKIYEYIGARRPIIAVGSKGSSVEDLLKETACGVAANTLEEIEDALSAMFSECRSGGDVRFDGKEDMILKYTRKEAARRMADVFNSLV